MTPNKKAKRLARAKSKRKQSNIQQNNLRQNPETRVKKRWQTGKVGKNFSGLNQREPVLVENTNSVKNSTLQSIKEWFNR